MSPNKNNRTRKISIVHNDYAFCIIEPLTSETIPCVSSPKEELRLQDQVSKESLSQLAEPLKDREIKNRTIRNLSDGQLLTNPISYGLGSTTENVYHSSDLETHQLTRSENERENFRRWSFSYYQHIYHPNTPNGQNTEFLSEELQIRRAGLGVPMTTLPRENKSRRCNHNHINFNSENCTCSSTSKIFSSILSIPERIRKLSLDKNPKFNAKAANGDTRQQMKKMYVY